MKVIVTAHGTVGVSVSADDVIPRTGVMIRDLIEFIGNQYQFAVRPTLPSQVAPFLIPSYVFQSGQLVRGDEKLPIIQLSIISNGDFVTAASTESAEIILDDFMERLDSTFSYRFASAPKRKVYQSGLIVEFDRLFSESIAALGQIEAMLNGASIRAKPFKLKRLAFGAGDIQQVQMISTIEEIESSDFLIERRVGEPYERNRFYCSAPVKTADHIKLLEDIERALGKEATR